MCDDTTQVKLDGTVPTTQVAHTRQDSTDVYIGRGDGGKNVLDTPLGERGQFGNPFLTESNASDAHRERESITIVENRSEAVDRFREVFEERLESDPEFRAAVRELEGKRLGCWCQRLEESSPACHGEVIAEYADRLSNKSD